MMNNILNTPDLRILLIKLRHHGDMLLTTPVINSLRRGLPDAQIDVLLYEETRDMLAAHPAINTIYGIDRKWKQLGTLKHLQKEWQLLCALRARQYHLVINLADQWRSAIVTRFTGAPVRLGFGFNKRKNAFWRFCHTELVSVANHNALHTVEQNLSILSPLSVPPVSTVTMSYSADDWNFARQQLTAQGVSDRYIVIQPTSRWFFKCWDENKMAQTITALRQEGHTIVLTAGPDKKELSMVDRILSASPQTGVISLAGQLSLRQLASLIDHADLFIGVDSVPMHMAAALQTPCVALFGPSKLTFWSPWQVNGEVIWAGNFGPLPDPDAVDTKTSERYLDAIPVDAVVDAAKRYLA
ncbi:putative lipopolysaccharide heptosyltransferase III [Kosakonia radicincitans]|uniref:putative lipopolysaccharide heptosyltransferase III n=1 Tax=Kosakonia radicincitans TaxID=283686 RepID=UPI001183499C|nr:putative lipopolysaccharide heptosyltransferase III [Kosakonia radicincitans]MDD7996767.1 putative lipopolysaccharide heptosyltransferase III [Kosakonia radicincitans]QEM89208.1 putative lipopolysaccharide heptosyltransferase III [Kosakonia radicincitans]VVT55550.1 Lipopolysaccharide core heptosyltransferase III [Kosakonia radicincitans]